MECNVFQAPFASDPNELLSNPHPLLSLQARFDCIQTKLDQISTSSRPVHNKSTSRTTSTLLQNTTFLHLLLRCTFLETVVRTNDLCKEYVCNNLLLQRIAIKIGRNEPIRKKILLAAVIVIEPSSKDQENPEQRNILYHILSMPAPKLNESGKRLLRDLKNLHKDPPAGIAASPIDNNIYVVFIVVLLFVEMGRSYYRVKSDCGFVICRPDNTPYEGGR